MTNSSLSLVFWEKANCLFPGKFRIFCFNQSRFIHRRQRSNKFLKKLFSLPISSVFRPSAPHCPVCPAEIRRSWYFFARSRGRIVTRTSTALTSSSVWVGRYAVNPFSSTNSPLDLIMGFEISGAISMGIRTKNKIRKPSNWPWAYSG